MILGFRRGVNEMFARLECYAALVTDVLGQLISPMLKGRAVKEECLTLEDGTGRLFQNVDN